MLISVHNLFLMCHVLLLLAYISASLHGATMHSKRELATEQPVNKAVHSRFPLTRIQQQPPILAWRLSYPVLEAEKELYKLVGVYPHRVSKQEIADIFTCNPDAIWLSRVL